MQTASVWKLQRMSKGESDRMGSSASSYKHGQLSQPSRLTWEAYHLSNCVSSCMFPGLYLCLLPCPLPPTSYSVPEPLIHFNFCDMRKLRWTHLPFHVRFPCPCTVIPGFKPPACKFMAIPWHLEGTQLSLGVEREKRCSVLWSLLCILGHYVYPHILADK